MNANVVPLASLDRRIIRNHGTDLGAAPAANSECHTDAMTTEGGVFFTAEITAQNSDAAAAIETAGLGVATNAGRENGHHWRKCQGGRTRNGIR